MAAIVAAEVLAPIVGFVVDEDRDGAFDKYFGIHFATQAIGPARRGADGENHSLLDDPGNGGKTPVGARTYDQTRADGELVERYLIFGSFHVFLLES